MRSPHPRISARIKLSIIKYGKELRRASIARPSKKLPTCRRYLAAHGVRTSELGTLQQFPRQSRQTQSHTTLTTGLRLDVGHIVKIVVGGVQFERRRYRWLFHYLLVDPRIPILPGSAPPTKRSLSSPFPSRPALPPSTALSPSWPRRLGPLSGSAPSASPISTDHLYSQGFLKSPSSLRVAVTSPCAN